MKNTPFLKVAGIVLCATVLSACGNTTKKPAAEVSTSAIYELSAPITQSSRDTADKVDVIDLNRPVVRTHVAPGKTPKVISSLSRVFDFDKDKTDSLHAQTQQTIILEDQLQSRSADQYEDIWARMRAGFTMNQDLPGVTRDRQWFARNQAYLDRVAERARPYLHYIVTETEKRNMPLEMALLPVVESAFQPFAYSHGRAAGIWQFIPGTGRMYGLKQNWWYDGRRDIYAATQAALKYLKALHREFGDWELALASYNSGSGNVRKAIRKNKRRGKPTDYWSLDLPKETEGYVPKLLAISAIVADPEKYGITLKSIPNSPYFARIQLDGQIDLALAAEMAEISVDEMYRLNPGYNRWATDPKGTNYLMVPLEKEHVFRQQLAALPQDKRIHWERHRIKKGENIITIAKRYNTTAAVLKDVNNLRGNMIREGRNLIIPVAMKGTAAYTHSADKRRSRIQNTARAGRSKQTHRVRKGDSFWTLSRKYGVGVRELAKWNSMAPRDTLKLGQKLVIWAKKRSSKKVTAVDTSRMIKPPISQTKRWIRYVVRRGDSLARIAQKFRVSIGQMKRWNKSIARKKYLQPGQRVKIFVDVTRQSH